MHAKHANSLLGYRLSVAECACAVLVCARMQCVIQSRSSGSSVVLCSVCLCSVCTAQGAGLCWHTATPAAPCQEGSWCRVCCMHRVSHGVAQQYCWQQVVCGLRGVWTKSPVSGGLWCVLCTCGWSGWMPLAATYRAVSLWGNRQGCCGWCRVLGAGAMAGAAGRLVYAFLRLRCAGH
jgi:hypothetical protein